MTLYKRREYFLTLPNGKAVHHFQASDPTAAQIKAAAIAAKENIAEWTLGRDPEATYTYNFSFGGQRYAGDTGLKEKRQATEFARLYRDGVRAGRLKELRKLNLRQSTPELTVGEVLTAFESFATVENLSPQTIRGYRNTLKILIRGAKGSIDPDQFPVAQLNASTVYAYKQSVSATEPEADDTRRRQLEASANSIIRQAKGVFSSRALEHYRQVCHLEIPGTIAAFRTAPGFGDTTKHDYSIPSDAVLAATFKSLAPMVDHDRDLYVAVWLALGFGLRKSEIAAVRAGWFHISDSGVSLELMSTVIPGTTEEKSTTKNMERRPTINCTNGAWTHLQPIVAALQPHDYLISAKTATGRCEEVFRRVSVWMGSLGWSTTKTMHEWRAYAGCQVAMRDGIEAASRWMRHSSIVLTQRFYGRYLRPRVTDAPLSIPQPATFEPRIVKG